MKIFINKLFKLFGLKLIKYRYFMYSQKLLKKYNFIRYLDQIESHNFQKIFNIANYSKSENSQDIMVLDQLKFKKDGFFVEFGAGNGKDFSNTYLLEKIYNWNGILSEPCKSFHQELVKNRKCKINFNAVSNRSGLSVGFKEFKNKHYSKINNDKKNISYFVQTISLIDLLNSYECPKEFDYLSIDTEGSEFEIIKDFDFKYYKPRIISIEHNFINTKKKSIFDLLLKNGYVNIFNKISDQDSWYIIKNN